MSRVTPDLLASCLAEVRSGRMTIEECLGAHPAEAVELRRLLETASAMWATPRFVPDPSFKVRARVALVEAITAEKEMVTRPARGRFWESVAAGWIGLARPVTRRIPMSALVVALALLLTTGVGGGATFAAQSALPGDTLYPVKITVEGLQIRLAPGDEGKAEANLDCAGRRLDEAEKAIDIGRASAAEFAIESYSKCVVQAEQHLVQAAASGREVTDLATRLSENLTRQQAKLEAVQGRVPEPAKSAVARAVEETEKGLDTAISIADENTPGDGGRGSPPTQRRPQTLAAGTTAVTERDQNTGASQASATAAIPSALAVTIAQSISDVQKLKDSPNIAGESYEGLLAKLGAAREALERGRNNAVLNELNAFLNQLNAMQRSGNISSANYDILYADYSSLVSALGGTPGPQVSPNGSVPPAGPRDDRPEPSKSRPDDGDSRATIPPTVAPGPSATPGRPGGRSGDPEDAMPVSTPARVETPRPSKPDPEDSRGRPDGGKEDRPERPAPQATPLVPVAPPVANPTQAPPIATPRPDSDSRDRPGGQPDDSRERPTPVVVPTQPPAVTPGPNTEPRSTPDARREERPERPAPAPATGRPGARSDDEPERPAPVANPTQPVSAPPTVAPPERPTVEAVPTRPPVSSSPAPVPSTQRPSNPPTGRDRD